MKEKIKTELERHKNFQSGLLGIKSKAIKVSYIDIRITRNMFCKKRDTGKDRTAIALEKQGDDERKEN